MTGCCRPGCLGDHYARGYCRTHYLEAIRLGVIVVGQRGRRVGTSTLTPFMQDAIAWALLSGNSLADIARRNGVSRDQVRTIRKYLERLNA